MSSVKIDLKVDFSAFTIFFNEEQKEKEKFVFELEKSKIGGL